jgi:hypothetical protein
MARLGKGLASLTANTPATLSTPEAAAHDETAAAVNIENARYERAILDFETESRRRRDAMCAEHFDRMRPSLRRLRNRMGEKLGDFLCHLCEFIAIAGGAAGLIALGAIAAIIFGPACHPRNAPGPAADTAGPDLNASPLRKESHPNEPFIISARPAPTRRTGPANPRRNPASHP